MTVVLVLTAVAIIAIALWRGERARSQQAHVLTRARARRAFLCLLAWGVFMLAVSAASLVAESLVEVVGIVGGVPAGPIVAIGLFHALMVWRLPTIRVILGATIALPPIFFTDYFGGLWSGIIAAGYGLLVVAASGIGLRDLARSATP